MAVKEVAVFCAYFQLIHFGNHLLFQILVIFSFPFFGADISLFDSLNIFSTLVAVIFLWWKFWRKKNLKFSRCWNSSTHTCEYQNFFLIWAWRNECFSRIRSKSIITPQNSESKRRKLKNGFFSWINFKLTPHLLALRIFSS